MAAHSWGMLVTRDFRHSAGIRSQPIYPCSNSSQRCSMGLQSRGFSSCSISLWPEKDGDYLGWWDIVLPSWWQKNDPGNTAYPLRWCHNEHDGISNHQHLNCLLNRLFRCRSKKTSRLHVIGLCEGNSPVTSEFPTQRASNADFHLMI